jgi:hypothetical protein
MVPSTYVPYFTAVATAAAALIGLLFLAVTLRDESIFGKDAGRGGEALAVMAFTGLVNSFAVSLLAMIPGANVGVSAIVLAVLSLVGSVRLNNRLHATRSVAIFGITLLAYTAQLYYGIILIVWPSHSGDVKNLAYILFATLVVALARAWSLLRGKHMTAAPGDGQQQG